MIVYKSNGGKVGDGLRPTRVSADGQSFAILVDAKEERYSEVELKGEAQVPVETQVLAPGVHTFEGVMLDGEGLQLRAAGLCNVTVEVL